MYKLVIKSVIAFFLLCGSVFSHESDKIEVLFIGNSLTYVGNLPAVFETYSRLTGTELSADMIAIGGYSLHEHFEQNHLSKALSQKDYDFVVFQERGGDLSCELNKVLCDRSANALAKLVEIANDHGVSSVLLGTYQLDLFASYEIEKSESHAAKNVSIEYIPVSNQFYRARKLFPSLKWLNEDGGHPGSDLTLLYSILLNDALLEKSPLTGDFVVNSRIYEVNCSFNSEIINAMSSSMSCGKNSVEYSKSSLDSISALLREVDEQS